MQRVKEYFEREFDEESPQSRFQRVKKGIIISLIGGVVYALVSAYVNVVSYPGLHLVVNWSNTLLTWFVVSLALIAASFIVGWPTDEVKATIGGGIMLTVFLLLANTVAYLANREVAGSYFQVLVSSLPMVGVCVLAALALRQGINKIDAAQKEENKSIRNKRISKIIGLVLLLGVVGGFFSRFDGTAVTMLSALNDRLQSTDLTGSSKVRFPENVLTDVQSHYGEDYGLFVRSATSTVGALEVTIKFESGYTVTCQIPTASGSYVFMDACSEGTRLK